MQSLHSVLLDSKGNVVHAPNKMVALMGVTDLVIVDTPDVLFVCPKDRAEDVKQVVEEIKARDLKSYL